MSTMYAILPGPDMAWAKTERPEPAPGQVRIRVAMTAVNRADLSQAAGRYPPPPGASPILGLECAGVIDAIGADVDASRIGERVAALLTGGGYAEYAVVPASHTLPVPASMSFARAGALPEVLTTAFLNLRIEAGLQPGERVLLHAGASGVGTTALQLCRLWGNPTWVTVGSAEKVRACMEYGADGGSDRHRGPWLDDVLAWTDGEGVDVILDPVGGGYIRLDQRALAVKGRIVLIGLLGGRSDEVDLGRMLVKRQRLIGSVLRARSDAEKDAILGQLRSEVWPRCVDGTIRGHVHRVMPLPQARAAHELVASNTTTGKVLLRVPDREG
jgi:putative PIG3 family NAD(P)H quinone oxidoreductase